ncbi:hypothetical protein [Flammeovirga pacifica]|uniref:Secretion system C-terminal sorting domain-containing protein n=1 Tax=Flammeovirga pacifica TaxID=915059 RepID=A0A1S1Z051_FLAPC|nr:hypothetical protein [Flammeovirga pacifica]OHX66646.1 hypothetical protein NH26_09880 [Flammeovirga pacifica]
MKPFLFILSIVLTLQVRGQIHTYHQNINDFTADNITLDYTSSTAVSDITYTAATSQTLRVSNGATVILDIGGYTLNLRGTEENTANLNAVEIRVDVGSTLKIIGNVDVGEDTDLVINGTFIVTGNWTNDGRGAGDAGDLDLNVGEDGMFAIGGNASFDYSNYDGGTYPQNIFIGGNMSVTGAAGDFSMVNTNEFPFGTAAIDFASSDIVIDLWENVAVDTSDLDNDQISSTPLVNLVINTADGWGNKYLKVSCTDFSQNEVVVPDQTGNPISSISELQTLIRRIKWRVLDNTVNQKLVTYHHNKDGKTDHINTSEREDMKGYLQKNRVVKLSFVDKITDTTTTYSSSSSRLMGVNTIEDINIDSDLGDLPVSLLFFDGYIQGNKVLLKWATASEFNNAYFLIEKSQDQLKWEEVIKIHSSNGNSNHRLDYQHHVKREDATTYYRLIQYDYDGSFEIFPSIFIKSKDTAVNIFPTMLSKANTLKVRSIGHNYLFLLTTDGKMIYQTNWNQQKNKLEKILFPSDIPSGQYIIIIKSKLSNFRQHIVLY